LHKSNGFNTKKHQKREKTSDLDWKNILKKNGLSHKVFKKSITMHGEASYDSHLKRSVFMYRQMLLLTVTKNVHSNTSRKKI